MIKKSMYFSFEFVNNTGRGYEVFLYRFPIIGDEAEFDRLRYLLYDGEDDRITETTEVLSKKFGEHEFEYDDLYGFTSHDVEIDAIPELMGEWQTFFRGLDAEVGEVTLFSKISQAYH